MSFVSSLGNLIKGVGKGKELQKILLASGSGGAIGSTTS